MSTPVSYSPEAMWIEADARIFGVRLADGITPENCIFVKFTGNYNPNLDGSVPEVTPCAEDDLAAGILYNVSDPDPTYSPATKYRRNFKMARRFECRMYNNSGFDIVAFAPITTGGATKRVKLFVPGTSPGRAEGYAMETIPNGKYGRVWINDG